MKHMLEVLIACCVFTCVWWIDVLVCDIGIGMTANKVYGIHFETAAERRWRLRPPVEDRARVRAQKLVGELVDSLVAGEHEAKHGWKLTK